MITSSSLSGHPIVDSQRYEFYRMGQTMNMLRDARPPRWANEAMGLDPFGGGDYCCCAQCSSHQLIRIGGFGGPG